MSRPIRVALIGTLVVPRAATGQRLVPTLDVGGASVRYADSVTVSAISVGPALRASWSRATVEASGTFSELSAGGWTTQGSLDVSLFTPPARNGLLLAELSGTAGGSAHQDGTRTGQSVVIVRGHAMARRGGGWLGGGLGSAWDGLTWRMMRLGELGAWARLGEAGTALVTVTPTVVGDTIHYTDSEGALRWEGMRVEAGASLGVRAGQRLPTAGGDVKGWGSATVTAWLAGRLAVVGAAGTYPVDYTQGFPGGRFVSLALRFGARARRSEADLSLRGALPDITAPPTSALRGFEMTAGGPGRQTLRVHAPAAGAVEIAGDFTEWSPVRLTRAADGWWTVTLPLTRGTYQMNVRLDGGPWLVPPGLPALRDEFGGEVGVLAVP